MRIPWYISIPLSVAAFCAILWIGARNKEFTTPPSDQAVSDAVHLWKAKHPPLPPRLRDLPTASLSLQREPTTTSIKPIPFGDLSSTPDLSHFAKYQQMPAASFMDLAIRLESKGELAHALLAWERVIDTCQPSGTESTIARQAIHTLRDSLPIWNSDSQENFDLIIHINTPEQWKKQISASLANLSESIQQASSYIVAPQVLLKTIPAREDFPPPPVRIWLSSTSSPQKETPQLTFRIKDTSLEKSISLDEQLHLAIYRSISGQFQNIHHISPPAAISQADSAKDALKSYMTRLHWRKLCDSLSVALENPSSAIIPEKNSEHQ